ncbi:MAG: NTP transferase domain-containing protein [Bacteroidetes bacterium]|nr:NTP transferase domain-containing protein [Bacteroidota bacterium]
MRAVIPVAGVGTRLRPHTYTLPKVLLNVAGKPILGHILDKIIADGIKDATIIIGDMGDLVREYVNQNFDLNVSFIEQHERKGLAHSIYIAKETFSTEPLLIILGDTIYDVDLSPILKSKSSSLGVKAVDDPRRFGVVEMKDGFISRLVEKPNIPPSNLAIVGLYYIAHPQLLVSCIEELIEKDIKTKDEYQLTDALQLMVEHGEKISTFNVEGWYDCGKPETLLSTNRYLLRRYGISTMLEGNLIIPPVSISPKAKISNSIIGPYTTIADNVKIEESIIRNSIISEDAKVEKAMLDNSIIGNNAAIKGGYKRINLGDSSEIDFY